MSRKDFTLSPLTGVTETFFKRARDIDRVALDVLNNHGQRGVTALAAATPEDSGLTARSWRYEVVKTQKGYRVDWYNDNISEGGAIVAILLQYGHGTRGGTFVQGTDYVNPAMQSIFDSAAENIWKEVQ